MRLTEEHIREWSRVGGWHVDPRSGHRVHTGEGLEMGDGADIAAGVSLAEGAIVPDGASLSGAA